ncbi:SusC/RagA family TonB-linked outer membrane protein [Pedobacter nototheniae]|uniref:SusC/RagA family TonB-linked outer membrane protein n=1 Tax=Pedobacter nototheniae TaxID=2488994 RepID=UPI002930B7A0|nr:SusC/RagA family TonB-linked outer membrane protein [Pedobacter nototheniae]
MNLSSYAETAWLTGRLMRKTILVMKLIFFIITVTCVQVAAVGYSQTVNIQQNNAPLTTIFSTIEKQTGYNFFWKDADLSSIKINVKLQNASLETALKEIFKGLSLTYSITKKSIVIQQKETSVLDKIADVFKDTGVRGYVYGADGLQLPGATVSVKNGKARTITNARGEFSLKDVPDDAILQVSFMGYTTKEVGIGNRVLEIRLQLSNSKLDEVQVMAYGKTSRRFSTGNIASVTAEEIEKQPIMNPLLALVGKVPGMNVTPATGYANGTVKVEIRGRSTISPNYPSEPLYVIDGVPLIYLNVGGNASYESGSPGIIQNGSYTAGNGQSPLFNINPLDIESIDVLKDADATAIYGSKGANGVILITTKKGKAGPTQISAGISHGISQVTRYWDMLNTQDYVKMRKEAFKNDGIPLTLQNAPDIVGWDTTRYTNWQKELWGNTGQMTRTYLSISGGDENTQFMISPSYTRSTSILTVSGSDQVAGTAVSINNAAFNKRLKTALTVNYTYSNSNINSTPSVATLPPNAPPIYDGNGELNYKEWNDVGLQNSYPFGTLKTLLNSTATIVMTKLNLSYEVFNGLQISSLFGFNTTNQKSEGRSPISAQNPIDNPTGGLNIGTNNNQTWSIEPQMSYNTTISKGDFSAFLGTALSKTITSGQNTYGLGYTDDNLLGSLQLAPTVMIVGDTYGQLKYAALFGRINYNWDRKYIINLSGRRDGSSRFGPGKRYGNFGSLGFAWIASEESWIKRNLPSFIDFVKFKGSYGLTGSDGVGDYQYISQWSNMNNGVPYYTYGGVTPLVSLHAVNPNFQWQVNKKLDLSFEINLFQNLNINVDYYRNRCGNQLTDYPTPLFTGFGAVTANWSAVVQNSGWEFELSAMPFKTNNFSWNLSLNTSFNKNILLSYPDLELSSYATQYVVGKSVNDVYLLHYIGLDPMTGQYVFEDHNKDGSISSNSSGRPGSGYDDRYITINRDPKFTVGMSNTFRYKDFSLLVNLYYKNQMGISAFYSGVPAGNMVNIPTEVFNNRWQQPGQSGKYAALTSLTGSPSNSVISSSDLAYTDASFLRLQTVSLSYMLPKKFLDGKRLGVSINAQNLWVLTKYKGIDPDTQNFGSLPQAKTIVASLSLTL